MTTKSEIITYNVHERGRQSRGIDRQFDLAALGRLIRSPEVQEKVKHGDLMGYLGHWPRLVFGMAMCEGGIHNGKAVALEPAVRTIMLTADDQGNITHQQEFLDTKSGSVAANLYASSAGGFSSAIDAVPKSTPSLPIDFHGFDFVYEPNYSTNRGYEQAMLDSVGAGQGVSNADMFAMLDAVAGEATGAAMHLSMLLDSLSQQHQQALEALERVTQENEDLIAGAAQRQKAKASAVLDDAGDGRAIKMTGTTASQIQSMGKFTCGAKASSRYAEPLTTGDNPILNSFGL